MKRIYLQKVKFIGVLMLSFMLCVSCEDYLTEQPRTQVDVDEFYQNQSDALSGLAGAYAQLKASNGYYRQLFLSNLYAASDQGQSSFNHRDFRFGTITETEPLIERAWIDIYVAIKDANNVIARVPSVEDIDDELKMRILGEARFLRALHYFNLVRCYGEVPLRTTPVLPGEEGLPKSTVKEIYEVIIADLEYAAQHCWGYGETRNGVINNIGRVTKATAHGMLSKVYVQMASSLRTAQEGQDGNAIYLTLDNAPEFYYQKAAEQASLAIEQPFYRLSVDLQEYTTIFDANNGNNHEMLFDIQGASIAGEGTALSNLFTPRNSGLAGGGFGGANRLQPQFINASIDKNDPRYLNTIIQSYQDETRTYELGPGLTGYIRTITETGQPNGSLFRIFTSKYVDTDATTEYTSQQNWHVIRLADVYLIRAEALAELNQDPSLANNDINALRSRAEMANLFDGTGLSMEEFRDALLRERGVELFMEGQRFFDLTRLGVYDEYCKVTYGNSTGTRGAEDYTWPIPFIESSANPNID